MFYHYRREILYLKKSGNEIQNILRLKLQLKNTVNIIKCCKCKEIYICSLQSLIQEYHFSRSILK